jgi:2-polyprenyl-3-methyl-5-hydroxy-6-metoxy-1,4-benzoquinol methylase
MARHSKATRRRTPAGPSQVTKSDAVLEIGCSAGVCTSLLARHAGRVVGVDNSPQLIREVRMFGARRTCALLWLLFFTCRMVSRGGGALRPGGRGG